MKWCRSCEKRRNCLVYDSQAQIKEGDQVAVEISMEEIQVTTWPVASGKLLGRVVRNVKTL